MKRSYSVKEDTSNRKLSFPIRKKERELKEKLENMLRWSRLRDSIFLGSSPFICKYPNSDLPYGSLIFLKKPCPLFLLCNNVLGGLQISSCLTYRIDHIYLIFCSQVCKKDRAWKETQKLKSFISLKKCNQRVLFYIYYASQFEMNIHLSL